MTGAGVVIDDLAYRGAQNHGDRPAIVGAQGTRTYAELSRRVSGPANPFSAAGVGGRVPASAS